MTRRPVLVVVALLLAPAHAAGPYARQEKPASGSADLAPDARRAEADLALDARLAEADAHLIGRRYAPASAAYDAVAKDAAWRPLEATEARALEGLARAQWGLRALPPARTHATAALALRERMGDQRAVSRVARLVSELAESARDAPAALAAASRARAAAESAGDLAEQARAELQWAGLVPASDARRLVAFESAVSLARSAGTLDLVATALHQLGDHFFGTGNYDAALPALEEAETLYRQLSLPVARGRVYNSLGRVYRAHGRLDEALRLQQQALALHERGGDPLALVQSLNAVSAVYQRLGDLPNARAYLDRALSLVPETGSPLAEDFLQANLAGVLGQSGAYARAAQMLEAVLARGLDNFPSLRYGQLSFVYSRLGRGVDALMAAERAVAACGGDAAVCASAILDRATAHRTLGDLAAARVDADAALASLEEVRAGLVPTDYFKRNFYDSYLRGITDAIDVNMQDAQGRRALEIAEGARSRALLDLLASRAIGGVGNAGFRTRRQQLAEPSSVENLVEAARRLQSTVLSYWVGDDALFVWVVGPQGQVYSRRVEVLRSTLAALVAATAPLSESPATPAPARTAQVVTRGARSISVQGNGLVAWRSLYRLLIEPIRPQLTRMPGALLTVIPHGPLQNLSFAALQDARGRYLLEDYTLHYVSAGALFEFTSARRHAAARTGQVLIVSDPLTAPVSKLDRPLPRLAGARGEARAIARLLPARQITAVADALAGETQVRAQMLDKAVLHFATHAVVRDDDPFASYLALAPSPGQGGSGAASDGFLRAEDIYDLDLQADLVVLSACRSAGGSVTGDGVATFARAFIYAGASSIVASVWDVADEPTNRLLPAFYKSWLGGASKARALRRAQLALLNDLRAGRVRVSTPVGSVPLPEHPAFWAGFALFGEPE